MGVILALVVGLVIGLGSTVTTTVENYSTEIETEVSEIEEIDAWFTEVVCDDFGLEPWEVNLYYTDELDYDKLTTRKERGEIIVERIVGTVLDDEYNGRILTTEDDFYNYISYRNIGFDVRPGDFVVTYCLYNPATDFEDDIYRYDYPISEWK